MLLINIFWNIFTYKISKTQIFFLPHGPGIIVMSSRAISPFQLLSLTVASKRNAI